MHRHEPATRAHAAVRLIIMRGRQTHHPSKLFWHSGAGRATTQCLKQPMMCIDCQCAAH